MPEPPRKVLIFTASAGGGHVAASQAVRAALEQQGHRAEIVDGLALMSRRLRWVQVDFYAWQLEHVPWSYGLVFRALGFKRVVRLNRSLIGTLWGNRLLTAIDAAGADVVVSTFPTVTAGLGHLIARGKLAAPTIAVITDFGVHPMWVSPHLDLHLVLSAESRRQAEAEGGRAELMRYPVDPRFRRGTADPDARAEFGIPPDAYVCLIVGGAWGVGNIEDAAAQAAAAGAYPVVVTGRNDELRARLQAGFPDPATALILGWTNAIPRLMAAADCLIQNAGGVTCLEAMEVGLPIVFYRTIPGHGQLNAAMMERAGAAFRVGDDGELRALLAAARAGTSPLSAPRPVVGRSVLDAILHQRPMRTPPPPPAVLRPRPLLAVAAAVLICLWLSVTSLVMPLTARALGHPIVEHVAGQGEAIVAVETDDPSVAAAVQAWMGRSSTPVALFVSADAAEGLGPGGDGEIGLLLPPARRNPVRVGRSWVAETHASHTVRRHTGVTPRYVLLTGGKVRIGAVISSPEDATLLVAPDRPGAVSASGILVVDTRGFAPEAAVTAVAAAVAATCEGQNQCVGLPHAADGSG